MHIEGYSHFIFSLDLRNGDINMHVYWECLTVFIALKLKYDSSLKVVLNY